MKNHLNKPYFTTTEAAKILGISRIAIFKRIKKGQLAAERYGRNYLIKKETIEALGGALTDQRKKEITENIECIFKEYGEALRLLGKE